MVAFYMFPKRNVIDRVPGLGLRAVCVKQAIHIKLIEQTTCIEKHGEDKPESRNWKRKGDQAATVGARFKLQKAQEKQNLIRIAVKRSLR